MLHLGANIDVFSTRAWLWKDLRDNWKATETEVRATATVTQGKGPLQAHIENSTEKTRPSISDESAKAGLPRAASPLIPETYVQNKRTNKNTCLSPRELYRSMIRDALQQALIHPQLMILQNFSEKARLPLTPIEKLPFAIYMWHILIRKGMLCQLIKFLIFMVFFLEKQLNIKMCIKFHLCVAESKMGKILFFIWCFNTLHLVL